MLSKLLGPALPSLNSKRPDILPSCEPQSLAESATMSNNDARSSSEGASIEVKHLSYAFQDGSSGLEDVVVDLPQGSRTLLIGGRW